jgi:ferredoxin/flavodoxin
MVFYFSGTGNSLFVAKSIADRIGERPVSIVQTERDAKASGAERLIAELEDGERVGMVFPVYAWGPPPPVLAFLERLELTNFNGNYVYAVVTSGKNTGNTLEIVAKHLAGRGYPMSSGFHVVMPNNYMIAGDVYPKEKEQRILREADDALPGIAASISRREKGIFSAEKGAFPWFLSSVIHPAFLSNQHPARSFYATDACNGCGLCARVCTCDNIRVDQRPVWGDHCTQCLACINYCPVRAIEYGRSTVGKGRYRHPDFPANIL